MFVDGCDYEEPLVSVFRVCVQAAGADLIYPLPVGRPILLGRNSAMVSAELETAAVVEIADEVALDTANVNAAVVAIEAVHAPYRGAAAIEASGGGCWTKTETYALGLPGGRPSDGRAVATVDILVEDMVFSLAKHNDPVLIHSLIVVEDNIILVRRELFAARIPTAALPFDRSGRK